MAVQESGDKVHFLRKLIPGAADSSYGIYCARLAGLPEGIIDRAYGLLQGFEHSATEVAAALQLERTPVDGGKAEVHVDDSVVSDSNSVNRDSGGPQNDQTMCYTVNNGLDSNGPTLPNGDKAAEINNSDSVGLGMDTPIGSTEVSSSTNGSGGTGEVVQLSMFEDAPRQQLRQDKPGTHQQAAMKQLVNMVKHADLMNMTPIQAMQLINDLKMKANEL
jgi:DNA mismatch repair protein MutS